jgi:glycosyltransferase involved in cell wall biosynthesis/SAM-dependent methyltransferase
MADEQLYDAAAVWNQELQSSQQNLITAFCDFWPTNINTVLDVGCGDGKITHALAARTKAHFHGFDGSKEALSRLNIPSTHGDVSRLPFEDGSFDVVMTTDVFEHLPDSTERQAWWELFRVAKNYVYFVVPFREELLDAMTRCKNCETVFHVNWHHRSYDLDDVLSRTPNGWKSVGIILTGDSWSPRLPPETTYRRLEQNEWSDWDQAICPNCGTSGSTPATESPLTPEAALTLGLVTYEITSRRRYMRSHSEIMFIFARDQKKLAAKKINQLRPLNTPIAKWQSNLGVQTDLHSYTQVARVVTAADGGVIGQFPVYTSSEQILIIEGRPNTNISITVEDGEGQLYSNELEIVNCEPIKISLPRAVRPGQYGLLVRLDTIKNIDSIELKNKTGEISWFGINNELPGYYKMSRPSLYIQICRPLWIDINSLTDTSSTTYLNLRAAINIAKASQTYRDQALKIENESSKTNNILAETPKELTEKKQQKKILMLCHDQHLDRRVLTQALTLIQAGHHVKLVAFSFGNKGGTELTTEGIEVVRIPLSDVVPENKVYRSYTARQYALSKMLSSAVNAINLAAPAFRVGFKSLTRINWLYYQAHLLLTYHNRFLHDPLPFRTAFLKAARPLEGDVIFVHDLPALEAGVELANERNAPLVYDAHELYPEQKSFSVKQRKICSAMEAKFIKHADLIFAVNDSIASEMATRYSISKPQVLLNAIDPHPSYDPSVRYNLLRDKTGIPNSNRILLFQGGFSPHRNLENLIAAFSSVTTQDVVLVMMGFGSFGEKLKINAQKRGLLNKRVFFIPAVPQSELLQHSASADVGIIPYPHIDLNSYYCTPNKLFEFIQAGLPILANQSPELDRFVSQQDFGISYPMHTAKDIARGIDFAFNSDKLNYWKSKTASSRKYFSWKEQSYSYLENMNTIFSLLEKE